MTIRDILRRPIVVRSEEYPSDVPLVSRSTAPLLHCSTALDHETDLPRRWKSSPRRREARAMDCHCSRLRVSTQSIVLHSPYTDRLCIVRLMRELCRWRCGTDEMTTSLGGWCSGCCCCGVFAVAWVCRRGCGIHRYVEVVAVVGRVVCL